jgi:hydroxylamine reductase (hybrid-cluster protein)
MEYEKKQRADYVKRNILYSNAKSGKSYAGFLANALKNDWGHDWQLEQQEIVHKPVKKKAAEVWQRQGFKNQKEYDAFMFEQQMQRYNKASNQAK